jgi:hypothetical protein
MARIGFARASALASLALLTACAGSSYRTVVRVDPPDASLFINGKRVGTGDPRPYDLPFGEYERVFIQATKRGFEPQTLVYTAKDVEDILDTTEVVKITLPERR